MTPALAAVSSVPSFLSVSRKNRKSAAMPKKYYERVFMAAGCAVDLYTLVRMISLKRRLLDVYHRDADTDHRAHTRYTRELARPRNAPADVSARKVSLIHIWRTGEASHGKLQDCEGLKASSPLLLPEWIRYFPSNHPESRDLNER
jgi:hypothetical protein